MSKTSHNKRPVDDETQAKLVALKAHYLGREAALRSTMDPERLMALACIEQLARLAPSAANLRRSMFYTLVVAEIEREGSPEEWRRRAAILGKALAAAGSFNPFPLYMKIIDATTQKKNSGNYGDPKNVAVSPMISTRVVETGRVWNQADGGWIVFTASLDVAALAVELTNVEYEAHSRFLQLVDLALIARAHGLRPTSPEEEGLLGSA